MTKQKGSQGSCPFPVFVQLFKATLPRLFNSLTLNRDSRSSFSLQTSISFLMSVEGIGTVSVPLSEVG